MNGAFKVQTGQRSTLLVVIDKDGLLAFYNTYRCLIPRDVV
jgi:hypothetical protein